MPEQDLNHAGQGGAEAESDGAAEGVQPEQDEAVRVGGVEEDGVEAESEEVKEGEESDGES